jgi:hypothetical protein
LLLLLLLQLDKASYKIVKGTEVLVHSCLRSLY